MAIDKKLRIKTCAADYIVYVATDQDQQEALLGDFIDELGEELGLDMEDDDARYRLESQVSSAISSIVNEIGRKYKSSYR